MKLLTRYTSLAILISIMFFIGCDPASTDKPNDPNIVDTPRNLEENPSFVSPPTLQQPIYACAQTVVVRNFIVGATIEVYVNGTPVNSETAIWTGGAPIHVPTPLTEGQQVYVKQIFDGATSDPSNTVVVSNYLADYPGGLPAPRIGRSPLLACGEAISIDDAVPGAVVKAFAENPRAGGGFDPAVEIGSIADFGYMFVTPLVEGARISLEQTLCADTSPRSVSKIVQPSPGVIPAPSFDPQPIAGANIVVVWGPGGAPNELLNGAILNISDGANRVGGQPTPGGGQQVYVNPPVDPAKTYTVTQKLCASSPPTTVTPLPCSALGAPIIYPPRPNDTYIQVINNYPGARILVFANGVEIGDSGPSVINLSRPIAAGETIVVIQKLGDCTSGTAYSIPATCNQNVANGCGNDWTSFRQNVSRDATQPHSSTLGNAASVKKLAVKWRFTPPGGGLPQGFTASPIVFNGKVYVGGSNGRMYALDANTGTMLWQFPSAASPALVSNFTCNPSSFGIAASATIVQNEKGHNMLVFAAPDRTFGTMSGSSRLFALDPDTGAPIWASPEVAVLSGTTAWDFSQLHEQTGYSSPLAYNNRLYVGIANHCDNPIQKGKVKAIDVTTGTLVGAFNYWSVPNEATGINGRGGGVWNSPAGGYADGVYFTTGNTNIGQQEPNPNHGLSMIKVNKDDGTLIWKLQPVPFNMDGDPDWAAGAVVANTPCGEMVFSTMKDGWAYGVRASSTGAFVPAQWQFPPTGTYNAANGHYFHSGDGTTHGDTRYLVPGAAWNGTYISMMGGEETVPNLNLGFNRLHGLDACSGGVRWMATIPSAFASTYQMGPPTVTKGIIFIGTAQGHLVAIADPSVYPTARSRCTFGGFSMADCESNGYSIVKDPIVLLDLDLGSGSLIRNEPAIANDRIFISTGGSQVIMLEPEP